ncbi:type II toxin-antitoxin system VapC family toxin [Promethearchaeum syntrophicum]|uniref:Type II toxin-antitoxin system VapC family toxin n=1 Tax=Promethearchaeum syntrophicum TaxID=2594042 RepID=A0A5B9DAZ2_9ARCH|nr:type II toxin-antitoxin system VapC family toxin [Candidatus Prometheoarchaeum syntrophicum]QEE16274.1 VapC ribonuclease [Candidatus Prometheoarchaeum syntrophicum]
MGIFLDSGFFLGFCHPKDKFHEQSLSIFRKMSSGQFGLIYTSNAIITETATLLLVRTNHNMEIIEEFYSLLYGLNKFVRILTWSSEIEEKSWNMFKSVNLNAKSKKEIMSFVDVSNIIFCKEFQIEFMGSFDHHFDGFLKRINS